MSEQGGRNLARRAGRTGSRRVRATKIESRRPYLRDGRAPVPESEVTSHVMRANRGRNTGPEIELRRQLRMTGLLGYRLHKKRVPGRPDVSFGRQKVAIFVHGCYWHQCPRCSLPLPKSHADFWKAKFEANRRRDQANVEMLNSAGWKVLTLWECEIRDQPKLVAQRVSEMVGHPT